MALEATADWTLFHMVSDFELQSAMKLLWPVMGSVVRRRMRASFARTKTLIETRSP